MGPAAGTARREDEAAPLKRDGCAGNLGRAFSVAPKATTLVTKGVYSKIPHPMYAFLDLGLLGVVIVLRRQWLVAVWLGLVVAHAWAARREARVLEKAFGEAYRKYRAQAWW